MLEEKNKIRLQEKILRSESLLQLLNKTKKHGNGYPHWKSLYKEIEKCELDIKEIRLILDQG